jgi:hypothetical protein
MQQVLNEGSLNMQSAVSLRTEQSFRNNFYFMRDLPENLQALEEISWNYYWSWAGGGELFRELDPALWQQVEQNPRELLKKISGLRLWQKSTDTDYVEKLHRFTKKQNEYLSAPSDNYGSITKDNPVAYFSDLFGRTRHSRRGSSKIGE